MTGVIDLLQKEKEVARKSTAAIKSSLRNAIESTTKSRTETARRSASSRAVFKNDRLQRVTIQAPHYIFKQNFGFEGTKKNNVNMRLKATGVIDIALENTNAMDYMATAISLIRSEQVESLIRFRRNGGQ